MIRPNATAMIQPPDDDKPTMPDAGRLRAQPVPADADVSGLDRGAQASYRDNPPGQHRPGRPDRGAAGTPGMTGSRQREMQPRRVRVAGVGIAPMSTTGYQDAVEALAVLLSRSRHGYQPAEAA